MEDFEKSIKAALYERMISPLFGSFVLSWIVCNWKVFYYILAVNPSVPVEDRLAFITTELSKTTNTVWLPLCSTAIIILIYPFVSVGAYWVTLKFKTWQYRLRTEIENKKLLTLEQSIRLRLQIRDQAEEFNRMLEDKNMEIEILKKETEVTDIDSNLKQPNEQSILDITDSDSKDWGLDYLDFKKTKAYNQFDFLNDLIEAKSPISNIQVDLKKDVVEYFILNDIIIRINNLFEFTGKGLYYRKRFINERFHNTNRI